jgi:hypothetical protein
LPAAATVEKTAMLKFKKFSSAISCKFIIISFFHF